MFKKIKQVLSVNPTLLDSNVRTKTFRYPSPGSQPTYEAPNTEASDIADNPYYKRDGRKSSPSILTVTKQQLLQNKDASGELKEILPPPLNSKVHIYTVATEQPPHPKGDYFPIVNYK
eukprot:NODE_518_length_6556_cov_0.505653.p5 type:complete len:118 gc:universal NODE_518_length_6556_cov_0.505653:191-544(+)